MYQLITEVFVVVFCCCCLMIEAMLIQIHNVVLSCVNVFGWDYVGFVLGLM